MNQPMGRRLRVLIVEDNPGDQRLILEAFGETRRMPDTTVAKDGGEALDYLFRRGGLADALRPDLILLDLNLPKVSGREVLAAIKSDPHLKMIPVVVFSSSSAPSDVVGSYAMHANCYVTKPADLDELFQAISWIERFWLNSVMLPRNEATAEFHTAENCP